MKVSFKAKMVWKLSEYKVGVNSGKLLSLQNTLMYLWKRQTLSFPRVSKFQTCIAGWLVVFGKAQSLCRPKLDRYIFVSFHYMMSTISVLVCKWPHYINLFGSSHQQHETTHPSLQQKDKMNNYLPHRWNAAFCNGCICNLPFKCHGKWHCKPSFHLCVPMFNTDGLVCWFCLLNSLVFMMMQCVDSCTVEEFEGSPYPMVLY